MKKHFLIVGVAVLFAVVAISVLVRSFNRSALAESLPSRFAEAISAGDAGAVEKMLQDEPRLVNLVHAEETPLHIAARKNKPEVMAVLLDHGMKLDARGQWNGTALHWACWFGNKEAAQFLLEKGLTLEDKSDAFGSTPLLWAAHGSQQIRNESGDYVATVQMLIERGASADTYNSDGVPAIIMASRSVADVLRAHGAKERGPTSRPIHGQVA